jgi:hypothetical protein
MKPTKVISFDFSEENVFYKVVPDKFWVEMTPY